MVTRAKADCGASLMECSRALNGARELRLHKARHIDGILWFAGSAPRRSNVSDRGSLATS
jgi:hypothetical protein